MSIQVNDVTISSKAINVESAYHQEPGGDPRYALRRAAMALAVRELLRQRASELDLPIDDDEDAAIDTLLEREVSVPGADEETCRRWYLANPGQFRSPDMSEVRHILLAAPPDDLPAREEARQTAEALIQRLTEEPGVFPELARTHSRCPSAEEGGHLGQITRGETVPEFEDAVHRLPKGLAATPIKTRYGFHVVEILQRVPGELLPFDAVKERVAAYLEEQSRRRALSQYIRLLAGAAEIRGVDLEQAGSLLVQ
ncbi:peptidylprolyl isomerase [Methylonatrum kenyense]|uniref:peptidylprolyl isomerase n=1 Tax=Methylonatrum kenyense TaxID=455253 RepID=UPI0020BFF23E|nr:peptidylprolyl isomerase [Methylonatrum kenyense]MCK8515818.1 peptidylprolyl isomerase [Methylonatrum kenyense]